MDTTTNYAINHTIGFVRCRDHLLMLNRRKSPNMGLWNGLGGRIEPGESPAEGIRRELEEEAGLRLADARFAGIVTWGDGLTVRGGMYAFVAELDGDAAFPPPQQTAEGIVAWLPEGWVLDPGNYGVVANIRRFLPPMFSGELYEHRCVYQGDLLVDFHALPLPAEILAAARR